MYCVQLKDMIRVKELLQVFGLNDAMDQVAVANSELMDHMLCIEDDHSLRRTLGSCLNVKGIEVKEENGMGRWGGIQDGLFDQEDVLLSIKLDCCH